jgi:hypothetical protein
MMLYKMTAVALARQAIHANQQVELLSSHFEATATGGVMHCSTAIDSHVHSLVVCNCYCRFVGRVTFDLGMQASTGLRSRGLRWKWNLDQELGMDPDIYSDVKFLVFFLRL